VHAQVSVNRSVTKDLGYFPGDETKLGVRSENDFPIFPEKVDFFPKTD